MRKRRSATSVRSDIFWRRAYSASLRVLVLLLGATAASAAEPEPISLPTPRYEVRLERSHFVPMRDGIRLATDLYIPDGAPLPLPTILIRTPYGKARAVAEFRGERRTRSPTFVFPSQGFIVAIQDKRGKYESDGVYAMGGGDVEDASDTIDWLVKQPWSNGKVGMYGCSYLGGIQIKAAQSLNPKLAAILPQASSTASGSADNRYLNFFWKGGALELEAITWFHGYGSKYYFHPPAGLSRETFLAMADLYDPAPRPPEVDWPKVLLTLPLIDLDRRAGSPPSDWRDTVTHAPADPWWTKFGYLSATSKVDVPALFVNSWYDHGVAESLLQFNFFRNKSLSPTARQNQFVIISPTTHCSSEYDSTEHTVIGDRALGDARFNFFDTYVRWFDHWLRNGDAGVLRMPAVQYYVMGLGRWKSASAWPVPGTVLTNFFLHSNGHANSRAGTGVLSTTGPRVQPPDAFIYDPATPVPSSAPFSTGHATFDQRDIEMRDDVLVYSTPPLTRGLEVTGPVTAVLYVSSSARDTDFTAKLVDVGPDGTAYIVQEGILRARYRDGFNNRSWMQPDKVYRLDVDIEATSNFFAPGHQIRLEVSSSNFPRFDRNLNTGGNNYDETDWTVARNQVHHSAVYPSHLILPMQPGSRDNE